MRLECVGLPFSAERVHGIGSGEVVNSMAIKRTIGSYLCTRIHNIVHIG